MVLHSLDDSVLEKQTRSSSEELDPWLMAPSIQHHFKSVVWRHHDCLRLEMWRSGSAKQMLT